MIRRNLLRYGLPLLALLALGSAGLSVSRANFPDETAPPVADVARASEPGQARLFALGRAEPAGGLRSVGPEVAGPIVEMAVKVGSRVAKGDLLFRIEDRAAKRLVEERRAALAAAEAALAQVESQVETARADLAAARARAVVAEAVLAEAERELAVEERLASRNAAAGRDVERQAAAVRQARGEGDVARAEVSRAEAVLARLDPATGADLLVARAALAEATERLRTAESDLATYTVLAAEGGIVLTLEQREGETAAPGVPVLTLAAGEGAVLRVSVDEADASRVDIAGPGRAIQRGGSGEVAISYLSTEPEVRPNRELSGRADDRIDTRVVEFLYRLPPGEGVLIGQTYDVILPARAPDQAALTDEAGG